MAHVNKNKTRKRSKITERKYPSELSDMQWKKLESILPKVKKQQGKAGRNPVELRVVINAILYVVKSGCSWRMLPKEYPCWQTVYGYFNEWSKQGIWQRINLGLVKKVRHKQGRKRYPSAAIVDSQSSKTTQIGGQARGYDAAKMLKGRKRFILVDVLGLILAVKVVAADISEKAGAMLLLTHIKACKQLYKLCQKIELVWADQGYSGDELYDWVWQMFKWIWQIVKRSDDRKGFKILPKRWIVERTFAWLSFNRRLSKDYEKLTRNSESIIYIAMLPIMLKKL
jgi:putative transposase